MKGLRPVIASNGVHFLQMRAVGSHSTSGREKERMKSNELTEMSQNKEIGIHTAGVDGANCFNGPVYIC